jgi:hypothetical protein
MEGRSILGRYPPTGAQALTGARAGECVRESIHQVQKKLASYFCAPARDSDAGSCSTAPSQPRRPAVLDAAPRARLAAMSAAASVTSQEKYTQSRNMGNTAKAPYTAL